MSMGVRDRPLYLRVYTSLRAQMESGDVKVGDFLPPEPELQPIALITNYLLPDLVPGIVKKILKMKSLYSFFGRGVCHQYRGGHRLHHGQGGEPLRGGETGRKGLLC